jgi:hypothetical protein
LRRLDALFAERVLGLKVDHPKAAIYISGQPPRDLWFYTGPGELELALPHYTTSLDAAWEGVEKLTVKSVVGEPERGDFFLLDRLGYRCCEADEDGVHGQYRVTLQVRDNETDKLDWIHVTADHPALAIVLACLRAVGVTEQEIEEASK